MRARIALLIFSATTAIALASCAERDRGNPFDPANQVTGGRPTGFAALAREGRADLVWQTPGTPGLVGFQVWRRTADETTFHALSAVLQPSVTSLADRGLLDGLDHYYRLYFVFGSGLGSGPAEDVATPASEAGAPLLPLPRLRGLGRHCRSGQGHKRIHHVVMRLGLLATPDKRRPLASRNM